MALRKSNQAAQRVPAPSAIDRASAIPVFGEFTTVAGQFAAADVVEMIPWPANTVIGDFKAHIPDLDSDGTPAVTLDVGVLTGQWGAELDDAGAARVCGTELGSDVTTGQAGGSIDATAAQLLVLGASSKDRSIGFKVEAAPDVLVAGAVVRFYALFVPVPQGVAIA